MVICYFNRYTLFLLTPCLKAVKEVVGSLHHWNESLCNWSSSLEESEDLVLEAYMVHEHYLIFISFCVLHQTQATSTTQLPDFDVKIIFGLPLCQVES